MPKKECYVNFYLITHTIMLSFISVVIYLILKSAIQLKGYAIYPAAIFGILTIVYNFIARPIALKKESYLIQKDRIIAKGGGIFSSYERELLIKNITHVSLKQPYLENKFHQTGFINIQSAGGSGVEVHMKSLSSPQKVYQQIQEVLQENGFSLTKEKRIIQSKPHQLGVIAQGIFTWFVTSGILGIAFFGLPSYFGLTINTQCLEHYLLVLIILISSTISTIYIIGKMKNTNYCIFNDAIISKSSFWGYEEDNIPLENLSDSILQQGIIARMFGIFDLTLSCQGSGQEIHFQYIKQGNLWKKNLDNLIKNKPSLPEDTNENTPEKLKSKVVKDNSKVTKDSTYTSQLRINKKRTYIRSKIDAVVSILFIGIGMLLLVSKGIPFRNQPLDAAYFIIFTILVIGGIFLFSGIIHFANSYILYTANKYYVKEKSFSKDYKFFNKLSNEYNTEKVTGIIIGKSILDHWYKTCKIKFWSIGSSGGLEFVNVGHDSSTIEKIVNKIGIYYEQQPFTVKANVTIENFFKEFIFLHVIAFFVFFISSFALSMYWIFLVYVALTTLPLLFSKWYHSFQKLELYNSYLVFSTGILNQKKYYVRYDDIKHVQHKLYPFSTVGSLTVNITGEELVQQGNQKVLKSNSFTMGHIDNSSHVHTIIDLLIQKKITSPEIPNLEYASSKYQLPTFITSQPKPSQFLAERGILLIFFNILIIFGLIFYQMFGDVMAFKPSFLIFLAIAVNIMYISWANLYAKKMNFSIDEEKVTKQFGIFYKKTLTLHYIDIDYISKKQGFFNNMFKTGNIDIHTVGSSKTDLVLYALEDYENFYEILKAGYQAYSK